MTTKDKAIEIDGERFASADELIEWARRRVEAGPPIYTHREQKLFAAVWPYLKERAPKNFADQELVRVARNMYSWRPRHESKPEPKTPFDEALKEAEEKRDKAKAEWEAARERMFAAKDVLERTPGLETWYHDGIGWTTRVNPNPANKRERAEAEEAIAEAKVALTILEPAYEAAMVRVNEIARRRTWYLYGLR